MATEITHFEKGGRSRSERGDFTNTMPLPYVRILRERSRELRNAMTKSEQYLWRYLRKRQILDIQFYRQKPIGC